MLGLKFEGPGTRVTQLAVTEPIASAFLYVRIFWRNCFSVLPYPVRRLLSSKEGSGCSAKEILTFHQNSENFGAVSKMENIRSEIKKRRPARISSYIHLTQVQVLVFIKIE